MDTLLQVAGLGLIAVLLGLVLKKGNGVLALLLTLAACAAVTAYGRHRPSDTADGLGLRRCG